MSLSTTIATLASLIMGSLFDLMSWRADPAAMMISNTWHLSYWTPILLVLKVESPRKRATLSHLAWLFIR